MNHSITSLGTSQHEVFARQSSAFWLQRVQTVGLNQAETPNAICIVRREVLLNITILALFFKKTARKQERPLLFAFPTEKVDVFVLPGNTGG